MVCLGLFVFHDEGFVDADAFAATGFFDFHPVAVDGVDEVAAVGAAVLDGVDGGGKLFDYVAQPCPAVGVGGGLDGLLHRWNKLGEGGFGGFGRAAFGFGRLGFAFAGFAFGRLVVLGAVVIFVCKGLAPVVFGLARVTLFGFVLIITLFLQCQKGR